jgi:hypothetical protein
MSWLCRECEPLVESLVGASTPSLAEENPGVYEGTKPNCALRVSSAEQARQVAATTLQGEPLGNPLVSSLGFQATKLGVWDRISSQRNGLQTGKNAPNCLHLPVKN